MAEVYLKGFKELGDKLALLTDDMEKKVATEAVLAATQVTLLAVKEGAPVGTRSPPTPGNLRDNIRIAKRHRGVAPNTVQYVIFVRTRGKKEANKTDPLPYYWYFLEFGTSKMSPHPFLLPGFNRSYAEAANKAKDVAEQAIGNLGYIK